MTSSREKSLYRTPFELNKELFMSNEIQAVENQSSTMSIVTRQDIESQKNQRELLRNFVSSQLVEAQFTDKNAASYGEGDYGIITGTKKRCLFKQGAEKIQKLFKLGTRFTKTDSIIDREQNFAMFTYKAEVFHLATGRVIAEQEGTANSQEVKYKNRTVWKNVNVNGRQVRQSVQEETPIFDVLNTLMKMAQKRAMVGATILATGASEFFTQDMLEPEDLVHDSNKDPQNPSMPSAVSKEEDRKITPEHSTNTSPTCCGKPMMLSKYVDRNMGIKPFYCVECKKKVHPDQLQSHLPTDNTNDTMFE